MKQVGEMGCEYLSEVLEDLVGPDGYSKVDLLETGSSFANSAETNSGMSVT